MRHDIQSIVLYHTVNNKIQGEPPGIRGGHGPFGDVTTCGAVGRWPARLRPRWSTATIPPARDSVAQGVHHTDGFVARYERGLRCERLSHFDVGEAHTARGNLEQYLATPGAGHRNVFEANASAESGQYGCTHSSIRCRQ